MSDKQLRNAETDYNRFQGYMVGMESWEAVQNPRGMWGVKLNSSRTGLVKGYNLVKPDAELLAAAPELLAKAKRLDEVKRDADSFKKYPTIKKINLKQLRGVIDGLSDSEAEEFEADEGQRNEYKCASCENKYSSWMFPDGFAKHEPVSFCQICLDKEAGEDVYGAEEFGAESFDDLKAKWSRYNSCKQYQDTGECPHEGCNEYDAESFGAEGFESEFSKGDLKKLKKYIDFPTRWINKETAPTSETKRRKAKNKFVGTLPAQKGIESMKHDIYRKTPTWFKGIQLGILATIFGAMYVGETKKK